MSTSTDLRAQRSVKALHGAFLELLSHKPLDQITARDITDVAGLGYATFFRHFPTKEALLNDIASDQMRQMVEITLGVFEAGSLQAANHRLFAYIAENRELWTKLMTGGAASAMRDEQMRLSLEVAATQVFDTAPVPMELSSRCTVSTIFETIVWWLSQDPGTYGIEEAALLLTHLLERGPTVQVSSFKPRSRAQKGAVSPKRNAL